MRKTMLFGVVVLALAVIATAALADDYPQGTVISDTVSRTGHGTCVMKLDDGRFAFINYFDSDRSRSYTHGDRITNIVYRTHLFSVHSLPVVHKLVPVLGR